MMYPMMGRRIHHGLDPARKLPDHLCMQGRLVKLHQHFGKENNKGMEPDQNKRQMEKERKDTIQGPETVGDGDIEMRG